MNVDTPRAIWEWPQAAYSILTAPPLEEPLTVAQAKLRAGVSWPDTDEDRNELMADYIKAARQTVEQDTALALLTQSRTVFITVPETGIVPWPTQTTPIQTILSITDPSGAPAPSTIVQAFQRGLTAFTVPRQQNAMELPAGAWTIALVAGWPTPADLKNEMPALVHCVGMLASHWQTVGRDIVLPGPRDYAAPMPFGYDVAINAFRAVWVISMPFRKPGRRLAAGDVSYHTVTIIAPAGTVLADEDYTVATGIPASMYPLAPGLQPEETLTEGGLRSQTLYTISVPFLPALRPAMQLLEECHTQRAFQILSMIPSDPGDALDMRCVTEG